jgi:signal transduction histidine kinase
MRILNRAGKAIQPWQQIGEGPYDQAAFDKVTMDSPLLTTATVNDESRRVYTALIPLNKPGMPEGGYIVQFSEPLDPTNRAVGVLTSALLAMVPIAVLLATLGGLYLTGRALRPVGEMQRSAERISGDNLSERLVVLGDDEFAQLGGTINRMLSRLQEAFSRLERTLEQQKRFTADASHELKTPLTVIKSNTGLALSQDRSPEEYRKTLVTVDKAASTMGLLVTDLLLLAKADAGSLLQRQEPFSLDRAIREAIDLVQETGSLPIAYEGAPDATVIGNPEGIRRVFVNLLTNAVQHTSEEGSVSVEVCRAKDSVAVRVKDTGTGIASEHLPHLTERFYRVDQSRTGRGSGLGLAICQEILKSNGGEMRIESQVGVGTVVTVTLPMRESPAAKGAGTLKNAG